MNLVRKGYERGSAAEFATLDPWPKLFHNLRASRQTELEKRFPSHVVCRWLGNSESIAGKHYLQVLDEHFEEAVKEGANLGALSRDSERNRERDEVTQNGTVCPKHEKTPAKAGVGRNGSKSADTVQKHIVPPRGVEKGASSSGKTDDSAGRGPESGPLDSAATPAPSDPALALLAEAWPSLTLADRQAILAIVRRASE